MLDRFARWFCSAAGVWQTLCITLAVVGLEWIHPTMDPQGIWLLYWLTIYSAVTQPALAYVSTRNSDKDELILHHIDKIITERLKEDAGDTSQK